MAAQDDIWTIKKLLDWSVGYMEKHNVDAPRLTAELLLAHALELSKIQLYIQFDKPMAQEELAAYKALLKRRVQGEPTQYILGDQEFWSMTFTVNPSVLIPRPDTECMIEEVLKLAKQGVIPKDGVFLDIGTGSGTIACALAKEFPDAKIHAVDLSEDALAVATKNVEDLGFSSQITLHHGDLFSPVEGMSFSLIVSNPPYIKSKDMLTLQREVRDFEPASALDGGEDGLDYVRQIVAQAPSFLEDGGALLCEIGSDQGVEALAVGEHAEGFAQAQMLTDYAKRDRILACYTKPLPTKEEEGELIRETSKEYIPPTLAPGEDVYVEPIEYHPELEAAAEMAAADVETEPIG
ncbi:MAG: protein-(glutamine-N5) methyltransferase, release factor-specific [Deltaproteobacteria bacterium]|nr:protein-(glutamine-N5) methyltransferase, release factor-specific [Deltaproteobacteria bacterium]|tara:strand:+ start:994 stop:2046 length:1053 start_codon:yes stop_codon:yes gene_type:complete